MLLLLCGALFPAAFTTVSAFLIAMDASLSRMISLEISSQGLRSGHYFVGVRWRKMPWANGVSTSLMACDLLNATTELSCRSHAVADSMVGAGVARPTVTWNRTAHRLADLLNSWVLERDTANARVSAVDNTELRRPSCLFHS